MSDRQDGLQKDLASKLDILLERTSGPGDQESKSASTQHLPGNPSLWLDERFASKFQQEFCVSQETPTLSKLVDLSIWWHVQVRACVENLSGIEGVLTFKGKICDPNKRLPITDTGAHTHKFVYFSKAHWLLRKIVGLEEYRQLNASSIWSQYIGELSEVEYTGPAKN